MDDDQVQTPARATSAVLAAAGLEETGQFRTYLNRELADMDAAKRWRRSRSWVWFAVFVLGVLIGFALRPHLAI